MGVREVSNRSQVPYLNYSYKKYKTYERFKFVKEIMEDKLNKGGDFLDIGCAKGEFIWYLKEYFPSLEYTGVDISPKLISLARRQPALSGARFVIADAATVNLRKKFNFVLMSGLLSYFDEIKLPLKQILRHLEPMGWGYIFGIFTEHNVDVLVRYRNNLLYPKRWTAGLNMFSLYTIRKVLRPFVNKISVYKFNLSIDLPFTKEPTKSYTLNTMERGRIILNGVNLLTDFYLIEFRKSKEDR